MRKSIVWFMVTALVLTMSSPAFALATTAVTLTPQKLAEKLDQEPGTEVDPVTDHP